MSAPPSNTYHHIQISGNTRVLLGNTIGQATGQSDPASFPFTHIDSPRVHSRCLRRLYGAGCQFVAPTGPHLRPAPAATLKDQRATTAGIFAETICVMLAVERIYARNVCVRGAEWSL